MPDRAFWAGRRVLVTGHTGFKGSWLSAWLLDLGCHVHGLALAPDTVPSLFELSRLADRMVHMIGDLRQPGCATAAFRRIRPEIVFHLAAQSVVRRGVRHPLETFDTNVMGTARLLDAAREADPRAVVVVVTSDKVYEPVPGRTYTEADRVGGADPYSASKACQEVVAHAYRRSFMMGRVATARAGNVIGGGDWAEDRVVPDLVRALAQGVPLGLRSPASIRPWQHVLDPLSGYLRLGRQLWLGDDVGEAWNFGPSELASITVANLADRLHREWQRGSWVPVMDPGAGHEAAVLRLDASRARDALGWQPRLDIGQAVRFTVEWYRSVLESGVDAYAMTLQQVHDYQHLPSA